MYVIHNLVIIGPFVEIPFVDNVCVFICSVYDI
jgi:hypothetical protein